MTENGSGPGRTPAIAFPALAGAFSAAFIAIGGAPSSPSPFGGPAPT